MKILLLLGLLQIIFCSIGIIEGMVKKFSQGEKIDLFARKISSNKGLPYSFYSLPVCRPVKIKRDRPSIGELFFGERVEETIFDIRMLEEVTCRRIKPVSGTIECPEIDDDQINKLIDKVKKTYVVQMEIDNLPAADLTRNGECGLYSPYTQSGDSPAYRNANGFLLGCKMINSDDYIVNNHLSFNIKYHETKEGKYMIVAFEVYPSSIRHSDTSCAPGEKIPSEVANQYFHLKNGVKTIPWSYSVFWEKSEIKWGSRWDNYIHSNSEDQNTHLFAIINSILVVVFLTGCVAFIMLSILRKDIIIINTQEDDEDDDLNETGWKRVHSEVFRTPKFLMFFSICIGSGVQICGTILIGLIGALIGILSPANRGGLMNGIIIVTAFLGILAGYNALKFYRQHEGDRWKMTTVLTALFFPGVVFLAIALSNFLLGVATQSTIAIPFLSLFFIFLLWVGVYCPLVFVGGVIGYKRQPIEYPCKVRRIPKLVPKQPWYLSSFFTILLGGVLPFGAIFIELYFIFSSLWLNKFYYLFGFLFLVFVILVVTTSEITIVLTYFQLCNEDYRWWWRSFLSAASSGMYLLLYSILYYITTLKVPVALLGVIYFTYMGIVCFAFGLMTGTIGFFAAHWFVFKIYSSIRID